MHVIDTTCWVIWKPKKLTMYILAPLMRDVFVMVSGLIDMTPHKM